MQEFLQQVVSGIASGGIFASLALALVLIYNAMGLVNFAQGEMAMFATFVAFTLIERGMSYWIALPATLVIVGAQDAATPPSAGQAIAQQIKGAKLASLDAAHISNMEQPKQYTETVLNFLNG